MKTAVITGTSTGIGYATCIRLAKLGFRVYAGMRSIEKATALLDEANRESLDIRVVELDVSNSDSVTDCFNAILQSTSIDLLVNNAGISGSAPLENTPENEHKAIFETNYFGTVRCIQAVLPSMRERGSGCIVNISSAAGLFATPTQIPYSASKWAVECLSEALAFELHPFGVRVVCIEPGVVKTSIFQNSAKLSHFDKQSPYAQSMKRVGRIFSAGLKNPSQPEDVADAIIKAIESPDGALRWPVGADAEQFSKRRALSFSDDWIRLSGVESEDEYSQKFEDLFRIQIQ